MFVFLRSKCRCWFYILNNFISSLLEFGVCARLSDNERKKEKYAESRGKNASCRGVGGAGPLHAIVKFGNELARKEFSKGGLIFGLVAFYDARRNVGGVNLN